MTEDPVHFLLAIIAMVGLWVGIVDAVTKRGSR